MTKLENLVLTHSKYVALGGNADKKAVQAVLDEITDEVLAGLTPDEICRHVQEVYDATVDEYIKNPHNKDIIDELIVFMSMLPDEARVYDIGCGPGRDTFFMSIADEEYRKSQMCRVKNGKTTLEKFSVPTKVFEVVGIDSAPEMIGLAFSKELKLRANRLLPEDVLTFPYLLQKDMHDPHLEGFGPFDAIWSCTALFTHTPRAQLFPAMESVARILKNNGIFFASYTSGRVDGRYDKLLLSSTGRIKYFSQPDPDEIAKIAQTCGLKLEKELFSDFEVGGKVLKKDLFVSQFFRKI